MHRLIVARRWLCFVIAILVAFIATAAAYSQVFVNSYHRKDGTYVRPHYRSAPDGDFYNNWSTAGNINPYTGKRGTLLAPPADYGFDDYGFDDYGFDDYGFDDYGFDDYGFDDAGEASLQYRPVPRRVYLNWSKSENNGSPVPLITDQPPAEESITEMIARFERVNAAKRLEAPPQTPQRESIEAMIARLERADSAGRLKVAAELSKIEPSVFWTDFAMRMNMADSIRLLGQDVDWQQYSSLAEIIDAFNRIAKSKQVEKQ